MATKLSQRLRNLHKTNKSNDTEKKRKKGKKKNGESRGKHDSEDGDKRGSTDSARKSDEAKARPAFSHLLLILVTFVSYLFVFCLASVVGGVAFIRETKFEDEIEELVSSPL